MRETFEKLAALRHQRVQCALVLVTDVRGHAPQVVGAKMVVGQEGLLHGTVGGGRVEHEAIRRAIAALEEGTPRTVTLHLKAELGMCCGGSMDLYIEPISAAERLFLFGAGHVAQPTARLATEVGFEVTVFDEREDWNSEARFPTAHRRVVEAPTEAARDLKLTPHDYVLIMTRGHDQDQALLERFAPVQLRYVGMIGSTRKVDKALRKLRQTGCEPKQLPWLHTPIGLDILAETPEEIAVAVVAELIRVRRAPLSQKKTRGAAAASMSLAPSSPGGEVELASELGS